MTSHQTHRDSGRSGPRSSSGQVPASALCQPSAAASLKPSAGNDHTLPPRADGASFPEYPASHRRASASDWLPGLDRRALAPAGEQHDGVDAERLPHQDDMHWAWPDTEQLHSKCCLICVDQARHL